MNAALMTRLAEIVGGRHVSTDPDVLAARSVDWTGRYRGSATALVRPATAEGVAGVLRACRDAGAFVTVQGGRTSLVAGTVPEHGDVLLSTERLTELGEVDRAEHRVHAGAGVTLAGLQQAAAAAGLLFGVDLAARDSATVGGMASTNAGGLRTVRYGDMAEQVLGLQVALPDGTVLERRPRVRADNTGYDLTALFVGAEGTLGVITALDLRLRPVPPHRAAALCGFDGLEAAVAAAGTFRAAESIAALELLDGRAVPEAPVRADWLLLAELAGDTEQSAALAELIAAAPLCAEPAVGVDAAGMHRLWQVRESLTETLNRDGPPLKFDVSLPLSAVATFSAAAADLVAGTAPGASTVLFGHIGEGNLHLNVLRCGPDREERLYATMMELIAGHGGNVSSEHGVGSRKRAYLPMSRGPADVAAMRVIKAAFDPTGYLNPAVLFD